MISLCVEMGRQLILLKVRARIQDFRDSIMLKHKKNVNEIEFILLTTILWIHHIDVRQIKVTEINTQS